MGSKGKGALDYILTWVGGLIVLFGFKDNTKKDVMHAGQAIIIGVGDIAFSIVIGFISGLLYGLTGFSGLSYLTWVASILFIALRIIGLVKVLQDAPDPKLPVIGDLTENLFAKQLAAAPDVAPVAAPAAKFDPNTGQPINPQPQANFDPNTGQPINAQPQAKFDPNTGQPLNQTTVATPQPETTAPAATDNTTQNN